MLETIKDSLLFLSDQIMARTRQVRPSDQRLRQAKIVAHRGNVGRNLPENTMAAFAAAQEVGAWGIEFDVRWSECGTPIIHHDRNCKRVHGVSLDVHRTGLRELRRLAPAIPTLAEVVNKFHGAMHFMIELKSDLGSLRREQWQQLKETLCQLEPVRDFHLMSLDYQMLVQNPAFPHEACLPIAEFNARRLSRQAIDDRMAGLSGQYLLFGRRMIEHHHNAGQVIGTGFVESPQVLYREINRGVDLIFSNRVESLRNCPPTNRSRVDSAS